MSDTPSNKATKLRELRRDLGGAIFNPFGTTEFVIDGGFINRAQSAMKRKNPEIIPSFNFVAMREQILFMAVEVESSVFPDIRLFRSIRNTRERIESARDMAELIKPVITHMYPYDKEFGPPSFFSMYFSMLAPRVQEDFTVFVTDDPAYPLVRTRLGRHTVVGPEAWSNFDFGETKFIEFEKFRQFVNADKPYKDDVDWQPMTDEDA